MVLIKNITISSYTSWDGEHTFAISNNDNGLLTLLGDSRNVLSIVLQITGIDNPPVVVMTNILYPLATDWSQGTVMLADLADVLAKSATRKSKPLVVSPAQLGSTLIDSWMGEISISQDVNDNITCYIQRRMQSSTASVTADNDEQELIFDFALKEEIDEIVRQTGIDYSLFWEITFYGSQSAPLITDETGILYAALRNHIIPSTGEGEFVGHVKVSMYAYVSEYLPSAS